MRGAFGGMGDDGESKARRGRATIALLLSSFVLSFKRSNWAWRRASFLGLPWER